MGELPDHSFFLFSVYKLIVRSQANTHTKVSQRVAILQYICFMKFIKEIIFIFTKDRPNVLKETLDHLKNFTDRLFIIDDSFYELNQRSNRELISFFPNAIYSGKYEFDESIRLCNIDLNKSKSIYRQLGNAEWNLGFARNYALLLTRINNIERVLFMDDDIIIPNNDIIISSFNLLEKYDFIGTNIGGMVDDSILGHISTDLGLIDDFERAFSGGFLAFNSKIVKLPFLNIYNEDWIWLFLHSNEKKHLQPKCVIQNYFNPYEKFKEKIIFQEYGEIIVTGIVLAKKEGDLELLMSNVFWERVIIERKGYVMELYEFAKISNKTNIVAMIDWLLQNCFKFESEFFSECFNDYLNFKLNHDECYI